MNRKYLPAAYRPPAGYEIPPNEALKDDTQHPELNSQTFRYVTSIYTPPTDYLSTYTNLIQNQDGLFILGTNDYSNTVYSSVLGASYDFNEFATSDFEKAKFSKTFKQLIFGLYFVDRTHFVTAKSDGKLELYSTKAEITLGEEDHREKFCFIKIGEHVTDGAAKCFCISNGRLIVGTSRGHFECYEYDAKGLFQAFSMPYGHQMEVTGISAHSSIENNWLSTSSDKSCLLWDKRLANPAKCLISKHPDRLTDVHWYEEDTMVASDSGGNIMMYDIKNTKEPISKQFIIDRVISSIRCKENKVGVVSETSKSFVYQIDEKKELKLLQEHSAHPYMIHDFCWDSLEKDAYYVVGDNKYAKHVKLPTQE